MIASPIESRAIICNKKLVLDETLAECCADSTVKFL